DSTYGYKLFLYGAQPNGKQGTSYKGETLSWMKSDTTSRAYAFDKETLQSFSAEELAVSEVNHVYGVLEKEIANFAYLFNSDIINEKNGPLQGTETITCQVGSSETDAFVEYTLEEGNESTCKAQGKLHCKATMTWLEEEISIEEDYPIKQKEHSFTLKTGERRWNPQGENGGCSEERYICALCEEEDVWVKMEEQPAVQAIELNTYSLNLLPGASYQLEASVLPSYANPQVFFESLNRFVAEVNEGVVKAKSNGDAMIVVKSAAGEVKAYVTLKVKGGSPLKGIKLYQKGEGSTSYKAMGSAYAVNLASDKGLQLSLAAGFTPKEATDVPTLEWESSNPKVAELSQAVTESGEDFGSLVGKGAANTLEIKNPGVSVITVHCGSVRQEVTLTVTKHVTGIMVSRVRSGDGQDGVSQDGSGDGSGGDTASGVTEIYVGGNLRLECNPVPADNSDGASVSWTSSKSSVAKVSAGGLVTGVAAGDAVITAKVKNGAGKILTATYALRVKPLALTASQPDKSFSLSLNKSSLNLSHKINYQRSADSGEYAAAKETPEEFTLTASVPKNKLGYAANLEREWGIYPADSKVIGIVSNNESDFETGGKTSVTIRTLGEPGAAYVYCRVGQNNVVCKVAVKKPATKLVVIDSNGNEVTDLQLPYGESTELKYQVYPMDYTDAGKVTFKASRSYAGVSTSGKVTGNAKMIENQDKKGPVQVYASIGSIKSEPVNVTVTGEPTCLILDKTSVSLKSGTTTTLKASLSPAALAKGKTGKIRWVIGDGKGSIDRNIKFSNGSFETTGEKAKLIAKGAT
ncbi:MAG: Ig-like domain-containing protein, partial [Lachnospiraceae bacterium]|nr:Ig-like domain-containing protein [Lachnospiraceae bacterium]